MYYTRIRVCHSRAFRGPLPRYIYEARDGNKRRRFRIFAQMYDGIAAPQRSQSPTRVNFISLGWLLMIRRSDIVS